ncbi:MAG: hypothetical protein D6730_23965 [Bacteroidetes bacterium]|nr:MAG: hypothetical protein D6730_23965 [Bacteroidota bacterium]
MTLTACKTGKKAFRQGDYEEAVYSAINRLRSAPNNKKALQTLKEAYPIMLDYYQDQIEQAKLSSDPLRWERVLDLYGELNQVYDEVQRSPAAKRALPQVRNFSSEYEEARRRAAEARYALGEQELAKGHREAAKAAYRHFERCLQLQPGFRDAEEKMFEAQDLATVIVQIEPIPVHSRVLELSNEFFENQIIEWVRSYTWSPFVRFYSAKDTDAHLREPDHIIKMKFDDFVVGQAYVKEREVQRVNDSVEVEVKVGKDSTRTDYITAKATVHQFTKEITSTGLLDVQIIDARNGAVISQRKFPGTFIWVDRWGFFNGDERALTEEDKQFIRKKRESPNPPPQDLFIEFTRPIFNQVTDFITDFYRDV